MHTKRFHKISAISLLILFFFVLHTRTNDTSAFGIKSSEIPSLYANIFVENGSEDIQWKIGAFLVDQFLNKFENIKGRKNEMIEEFEWKFKNYNEKKNDMEMIKDAKFGWEEVWSLFSELISDEYLDEKILMNFLFEFEEEWKKIKEIQNWEEMGKDKEKEKEIIEENLKLLIKKLHQNELKKLLVNLVVSKKGVKHLNQNELSMAIQKMDNDGAKEKKRQNFESMKTKMRKMVGDDWTYMHLEKLEPVLMRIDIIESNELLRIYKNILSPSTTKEQQFENQLRMGRALIFGEIWNLNLKKKVIRDSLNSIFLEDGSTSSGKEKDMVEATLEKWLELTGYPQPRKSLKKKELIAAYMKKKKEYSKKINEINKKQLLKLFKENKELKEFLDENVGSRTRIMRIFGWKEEIDNSKIEQIFIDGNEEITPLLRTDPSKAKTEKMFLENYLEAFQTKKEMLREKAAMGIYILIGVKYLDEELSKEGIDLEEEWKEKYRPMFFFYLDQMADSDWDSCKNNGIIYRNMLYKMRIFIDEKHWENGWTFSKLLKFEFMNLKKGIEAKIMMDDNDKEIEMELLKKDNAKIISVLRKKFPELDAAINELKFEKEEEIFHFLDTGIKNNFEFLAVYEEYLKKDETEEIVKSKEKVNLDATFWHYKNICDNLFESIKDLTNSQIVALKNNWENNFKNYKEIDYQTKKRKLCQLQFFIQHSLVNNEEIKTLDKWNDFTNLPTIKNISCDNDQKVDIISSLIIAMQTNEIKKKIYFDYLDWLISNFEEFQQFLLRLSWTSKLNIIFILNVKKEEGPERYELLEKLEKKHPKWLKIHEMYVDMRMELYKIILKTKEYLPESLNSQRRIAIALMVGEIKRVEKASENCGIGIENPEVFKMIKEKAIELLEDIYKRRGENFDSMENICILTHFRELIEIKPSSIEGGNDIYCLEHNGKEHLVKEYNGDLCKQEDVQNLAWHRQRELLGLRHYNFIKNMSDENGEIKKLIEKFGGRVRTWLLLPKSMENELLSKKNFSMDSILREHFLEALNAQNEEDQLANKLAVNFFSWARYVDKKLKNMEISWKENMNKLVEMRNLKKSGKLKILETLENMEKLLKTKTNPRILAQIWRERKPDLLNEYDALGNMKISSLIDRENFLARFHLDILEVIEKAEKEVFTKKNFEKIFNERKYKEHDKEWKKNKEKKYSEYLKRINEFNRDELIKQMYINISLGFEESEMRHHFSKSIFAVFKNSEALKILTQLIGENGIEKILDRFNPKEENIKKEKELEEFAKNIECKTLEENALNKEEKETMEEKESGISSSTDITEENRENFETMKNIPSSPKNPSKTEIIPEIGIESAESRRIAQNQMSIDNILQSIQIHSSDSESHMVEGNKSNEINSLKINECSFDSKENERKIVKKKIKNYHKLRLSKKARTARNRAQRKEYLQKKANEKVITEKLIKLLEKEGYGEFADQDWNEESEKRRTANRNDYFNESEFIILEMMELLAKWNKESRLLISGSMQLKLNSADSDIDLIVLLPYESNKNWEDEFEKNFMDNSKSKYIKKKCENGNNISLYCFLCETEKVISVEKIYSHVPLIKTRFLKRNIPVDLNMALVKKELLRNFPAINQQLQKFKNYKQMKEKIEEIMENQPSLAQIDELIRNIIIGIGEEKKRENILNLEDEDEEIVGAKVLGIFEGDKRNGMIRILSGYRANKQIANLMPKEENYKNFQIAFLALKLWASNHFIYGAIYGFLNGATLAVMICKLTIELGENVSALTLVEQFFHKYHKRGNEVLEEIHLEFKKNDEKIRNELDWTIKKEGWNGTGWKVITPGFPTQNAAIQITSPSDRIINAELEKGLEEVGKIRELIDINGKPPAEKIHKTLTNFLFTTLKFEDKYSHFVAIICKYPRKNANGLKFCNFLQIKLKSSLELLRIHAPQIDYFHIKPEIIDKEKCPEKFHLENDEMSCTIWLAGIKLKDEINAENVKMDKAINWQKNSEELTTNIKSKFYPRLSGEDKFDIILHYNTKEGLVEWKHEQKQTN